MKAYKKTIALLTAAVMGVVSLGFADRAASSAFGVDTYAATQPSKDNDGFYLVGTADELYWIVQKYNEGETALMNVKITNDIVVNSGVMTASSTGAKTWTPIGGKGVYKTPVTYNFKGVIDGQGHYISGLYCPDASTAGLVAFNYGTIKNLGIINSYFYAPISEYNDAYAGAFAGLNKSDGVIKDCYSYQ